MVCCYTDQIFLLLYFKASSLYHTSFFLICHNILSVDMGLMQLEVNFVFSNTELGIV